MFCFVRPEWRLPFHLHTQSSGLIVRLNYLGPDDLGDKITCYPGVAQSLFTSKYLVPGPVDAPMMRMVCREIFSYLVAVEIKGRKGSMTWTAQAALCVYERTRSTG